MSKFFALYLREVRRFTKIWMDTLFNPIVSMVLYLGVFGVVLHGRTIFGENYLTYIYCGLLSMIVVNGSFSNPGFALVIGKNLGTFIDLQLAPIKTWQIGLAYAMAAFTRGIVTLAVAFLMTVWFVPGMGLENPVFIVTALIIIGLEMGLFGVIFGVIAKSFESLTFITTFVLQPMIFLSGVFYPVSTLPHPWNIVSFFNPIFHLVNLFRFGVLGIADFDPLYSLLISVGITAVLFGLMINATGRYIRS